MLGAGRDASGIGVSIGGLAFTNVAQVTNPLPAAESSMVKGNGVFVDSFSRGEGIRWVIFAFVGFLGGQLVSTGLVALVAAVKGQGTQLTQIANSSSPPTWYIVCSLLGLWLGFLGAAVLALNYGGPRRQRLGLTARPVDLLGLVIGVGAQIAIGLMYLPFRSHLQHFNAPITKLTGSSHGPGFALIVILTVLGAPIVEEIFFRGVLFRGLIGLSSTVVSTGAKLAAVLGAILADGVLFGLAHGELIQLPGLAVFGAVLAVVFYRTGRLGMCIVAHISFNALALLSYTSSSGSIIPWH